MNKSDLAEVLAAEFEGLSKTAANEMVSTIFTAMKETLAKQKEVRIAGFGSFVLRKRAAREGRNPLTGKPLKIPAKTVVGFRPTTELKTAVDRKK